MTYCFSFKVCSQILFFFHLIMASENVKTSCVYFLTVLFVVAFVFLINVFMETFFAIFFIAKCFKKSSLFYS